MATVSITLDAQQTARVQAAFKAYWNMDAEPGIPEITAFLMRQLKAVVLQQERRAAESQIIGTPLEMT